jgi:HD-like signal output (HDOD) protein
MDVAEKVYTDKRLDEMIRAHREAQDTAQRAYEERVALAVNQAAEKSDAHDGKELEVQEEEPKVHQKEEKEKENADGDENGGDEGAQDDAQDGVGVPDHVSE